MLPGKAWAYAANPAAADRGRKLADLVDAAHGLGQPVVFLRNVPSYRIPGLGWLDAMCDVVLHDDLGVQLARFNPIDLPATRPTEPLYIGALDPGERRGRRHLLDQLTRRGPPRRPHRRRAVEGTARAVPSARAVPGRIGGPGPRAARLRSPGGRTGRIRRRARAAHARRSPSSPPQLDAARAAGAPAMTEVRQVLRDIFQADATPVRLAAIARHGRPARRCLRRAAAHGTGRGAGRRRSRDAGAAVAPAAAAAGRGGGLWRRAVPPPAASGRGPARPAMPPTGRWPPWPTPGSRSRSLPCKASGKPPGRPRLPWIAPWDCRPGHSDWYLLDLMCARECSHGGRHRPHRGRGLRVRRRRRARPGPPGAAACRAHPRSGPGAAGAPDSVRRR